MHENVEDTEYAPLYAAAMAQNVDAMNSALGRELAVARSSDLRLPPDRGWMPQSSFTLWRWYGA